MTAFLDGDKWCEENSAGILLIVVKFEEAWCYPTNLQS